MAISYTGSHATQAAGTTVSDAFGTALAGDLLIAAFTSNLTTLPTISCVGNSPTWVKIDDITYNGSTRRTTVWYAVALGGETSVVGTWGASGHHAVELLWVGSPGGYNEVYVLQTATPGSGNPDSTPTVHPTGNNEFYVGWTTDEGTTYTLADLRTGALGADGGDGIQDGTVGVIMHWFTAAHANTTTDSILYQVNLGLPAVEMGILSVRVAAGGGGGGGSHKHLSARGVG